MTGMRAQLAVVDELADTLDGAVEAEEITPAQVIPVVLTVLASAIASIPDEVARQKQIDMVIQNLADAVEVSRTRENNEHDTSASHRH